MRCKYPLYLSVVFDFVVSQQSLVIPKRKMPESIFLIVIIKIIYLRKLYIMASNEYIKGTIKTIVLKLLSENKRLYGYEINNKVSELSGGEIKFTYGALFPILYKLEKEKLLSTETELVDNRARKYYSLTPKGLELASQKVSELHHFTVLLTSILKPDVGLNLKTCQ